MILITGLSIALFITAVKAGLLEETNRNGKWVAEIDDTAELANDVSP